MPGNIKEIEADIKEFEGDFEKLKTSLTKCMKLINEKFHPELEAETAKLNKLKEERTQLFRQQDDLQRNLDELRLDRSNYFKKLSAHEAGIQTQKGQIKDLKDPKSKLRREIKWTDAEIKESIEFHKSIKKKYKGDITQLTEDADNYQKNLQGIKNKLIANNEKLAALAKDRSRAEDAVDQATKGLEEINDIASGNTKMIRNTRKILEKLYDDLEEAKKK